MYKCTECGSLYENLPEFCDNCGNDYFEETGMQSAAPEEQYRAPEQPKNRQPSHAESEEFEEEKRNKKISSVIIGAAVFIAVLIIALPPYPDFKAEKTAASAPDNDISVPSVNSYWDDTLPAYARSNDKYLNLPVLNKSFAVISPELKKYLVNIGNEFNRKWDLRLVKGDGEARIAFVINADGNIEYKQLIAKSNNESFDDSILMTLSKINNFDMPPKDYKGEKIILSFQIKDKMRKIKYPDS